MRDRINDRDGQLESILHKQGTRFTTMLAVAIFLSISALVAVCVLGLHADESEAAIIQVHYKTCVLL